MMEFKQQMMMKMDGGRKGGKADYAMWDQTWADADMKNLEYNFAGVQMCAEAKKMYKPFPFMGLRMEECSEDSDLSFNAWGNKLVAMNKYGKKSCLTAKKNEEMGWGHHVMLDECNWTQSEEEDGTDGIFQQFKFCGATGQIKIINDENMCVTVYVDEKGNHNVATCYCKAGMSKAVAWGRAIEDDDDE